MQVSRLAPGLWRWTAVHPEWKPGDAWEAEVACFYAEIAAATLLVDPLVPSGADRERFLDRLDDDVARRGLPVAIALTSDWHRRSADELAGRYAARVHDGEEMPPGVDRREVGSDPVLWIEELSALAVGDALISVDGELRLWGGREDLEGVRSLLELPVEHVLVAHGEHVAGGRDELAAALERRPHRYSDEPA